MSDLTGKTLGRYRIVERIGRGGMADVYKAYQPSLDRYVAIKVLHPFLLEEDGSRERFQREARAVAALRHPNIVQVFDFDTEGDDYFMVMEYIDGPNLKTMLLDEAKAGQRLALDRIEEIITAIGGALGYAHHQGMIHRDIKPHNIMFTAKGQPLLTDFGIAKIISGSGSMLSMSGALTGTPAYMSPEQGRGAPLDNRTDIYSLGVVLYEMITGRVPFDADTPFAVVIKHISDPLPLPHTIRPDVPDALERVVLKAMAKEPDERYQTVEDLVKSVQQAVAVARTTELTDTGMPITPVTHLLEEQPTGAPGLNTQPGTPPRSPTLGTMPVPPPEPTAPQTATVAPGPVPATALPADSAAPGPVPATALPADSAAPGPVPPVPPTTPPRSGAMAALSIGKLSCSMMVGVAALILVAVSSLAFLNQGKGAPSPMVGALPPTAMTGAAAPPPLGTLAAQATSAPMDGTASEPPITATPPPGTASPAPATGTPRTFTTLTDALQAGEQLLSDGQYAAALAAFNAALGMDLTSSAALRGIGQAQLGLNQYQEAVDALNGALSANPDDLTALLARSRAYMGQGDWVRAYDDANKAYALDANSVEALILRARANGLRGDAAAALADYQAALAAHPDEPDIYQDRGEWYLEQRQGAEAVADFLKALEFSPENKTLWLDLGRAYINFGGDLNQPDKSIEAFTQAIQLDGNYQRAYHDRGWVYLNYKGDYSMALADYNRAEQIGPGYAELYLDRAYCYLQMRNTAAELEDLNRAIALEPNNDYALERRYEHYYYATQYDLALADINKALELSPEYQAYHLYRSDLYLVRDQAAEAQGDAQFVVTANPSNPAGHLALARALAQGNDASGALAQVEQALALNDPSTRPDALIVRGWIALRADQQEQAAADFAEALKGAPYNRWALFGQAAVNIAAKRYDLALPDIETGIGQDSRYGLGYVLRAAVAVGQNQPVKAITDLQQAQRLILYPEEKRAVEDLLKQVKP